MPLQGIYPKDSKSTYHKDIFTSMFTAALFTNAKLWNQPRCPKRKEWIKKMWHKTQWIFFSTLKNEVKSTRRFKKKKILLSLVPLTDFKWMHI